MHCGVACLSMACSAMGRHVDLYAIEEHCSPTMQGVSLKGMADAAKAIGLKADPARIPPEYLMQKDIGPVILHWNQNHFVLFRRASRSGRRFLIADPAKGERWYGYEELRRHWLTDSTDSEAKGIALLLSPTEVFYSQGESDADGARRDRDISSLRYMFRHMRPYRSHLCAVILGLGAGCVLQLILPFLTQAIVDKGIAGRSLSLIWLILIGELLIVAGRTVTDFIRRRLLLHVSMRVNIRLLSEFFLKLMRLPMAFFDTKLMGDLLQRMSDHQRVQSFLTGQVLSIAFTLLSFLVFGVVLAVYSPLIFGVFLAGSVVYGLWIVSFLKRRKVLDYELFEAQSVNQNRTYQLITTMQEIKLHNCRERRRREWEKVQGELFGIQMRSLNLTQTQEGGSIFINEVKNVLITVLSATAVIGGDLTLGGMLAIQFIVGQLSSPVAELMSFVYAMQDVRISLERIGEIQCRADEDGPESMPAPAPSGDGIRLHNVTFRYDRHSPVLTIDSLNLHIPQGKVTAIVGESGSGKTTLVKLLLGFYAPESGDILVQGAPLSGLNLEDWRGRCGAVMQEGVIFSDTIAANIAMSDGPVDEVRMEEAARKACLHNAVMRMPMRYDTRVGADGVGLSRGQMQRILIARAIYRNPEYIFLDEATNSLDATNERAIVEGLAEFYEGRTVVIVAHRLSTVRNADNIVVLSGGRIVEQGTHDALVAARGSYYTLIKNQLELG